MIFSTQDWSLFSIVPQHARQLQMHLPRGICQGGTLVIKIIMILMMTAIMMMLIMITMLISCIRDYSTRNTKPQTNVHVYGCAQRLEAKKNESMNKVDDVGN